MRSKRALASFLCSWLVLGCAALGPPKGPSPDERAQILDVLLRAPLYCGATLLNDPEVDPVRDLIVALRGLDLDFVTFSTRRR